jgi:hypothetical protein
LQNPRLDTLTDGVFSVAMTLLVLDVRLPEDFHPADAQHTRRIVSEMAETVSHKQIPVYFDQMVDDVFLNGADKPKADTAKDFGKIRRATAASRWVIAGGHPAAAERGLGQCADRDVLSPQWRLDRRV